MYLIRFQGVRLAIFFLALETFWSLQSLIIMNLTRKEQPLSPKVKWRIKLYLPWITFFDNLEESQGKYNQGNWFNNRWNPELFSARKKIEVTIHTLPHLKYIRLVSVRSSLPSLDLAFLSFFPDWKWWQPKSLTELMPYKGITANLNQSIYQLTKACEWIWPKKV